MSRARANLATEPVASEPVATEPVATELFLEALARGNTMTFVARGKSMDCAIPSGSAVQVAPILDDTAVSLFEVVLAVGPNLRPSFRLHRVIGQRADGWVLLMGDNTNRPDGWSRPEEIVGRAIAVKHPDATSFALVPRPIPVPSRLERARARLWRNIAALLQRGTRGLRN